MDEDAISPLWKGQRFPLETCISGWAMLNSQSAVIPDIYKDSRIPHAAYRPTFVHSLAMVPIRSYSPIGAIGNYWARHHECTPRPRTAPRRLATSQAHRGATTYGLRARLRKLRVRADEAGAYSFTANIPGEGVTCATYIMLVLQQVGWPSLRERPDHLQSRGWLGGDQRASLIHCEKRSAWRI